MLPKKHPCSVGFISLGCPKNLVDSEVMAHGLLSKGYTLAPSPERCDILVVNTCAFIEEARKEAIESILYACGLKRRGAVGAVVVAGCLPQRYRGRVGELFPEVDLFVGIDGVGGIAGAIARVGRGQPASGISSPPHLVVNPSPRRLILTGAPYAYLRIADGCDHRCSFCAIPMIRGCYRSRPQAAILREAARLLERGFRELILVAQDVTAYGDDLGENNSLAGLVRALGRIGGRFWIRMLYGHPGRVTAGLLDAIAETPQACRYLDLPVQHFCPEILRRMGRGGGGGKMTEIFNGIRKRLPGVSLRTTCMVGFPGETAQNFRRLKDFIRAMEFDHLGVFVYSQEEGTRAAGLPGKVPVRTARRRRAELMLVQQGIVARRMKAQLGREEEILIERKKSARGHLWLGRSRSQAPGIDSGVIYDDNGAKCHPGLFVQAVYTGAAGYDLRARPARGAPGSKVKT